DDWLSQRPQSAQQRPLRAKAPKPQKQEPKQGCKPPAPRKLTFKEQRELDGLPAKIEKLETEQQALYRSFSDISIYQKNPEELGRAKARLEELSAELQTAYERWEYLAELAL
ncbi:MAG TPA: ABC transporter ATP-binding protein, partial [Candidatus Omnitrophota bacterium]|nr:ABC transporter ATP-binding protein [Candidatus Omnitrophota bacterium]